MKAVVHRTVFRNCRLTGSLWPDAYFRDVLFDASKGDCCSFKFAEFKDTTFRSSLFAEAEFTSAKLHKCSFEDTDRRRAEMSGLSLRGMDLRSCEIEGMRAGVKELQGVIIDSVQAMLVCSQLGLCVKFDA